MRPYGTSGAATRPLFSASVTCGAGARRLVSGTHDRTAEH
jgi:hypothetical protein